MECSQMFAVNDDLYISCKNPAVMIAKTYKHGDEHGVCSFCLWRLNKEDDSNFFKRHEFKDI